MKKILSVFLSLLIIFSTTTTAYANSAGWSLQSTFMNGATAAITAIKGTGSSALQSAITHKPTAVAVGKELIKVGGGVALAYAVSQLIGSGVDWVLDPANNRVKYTDKDDGSIPNIRWGSASEYGLHRTPMLAAEAVCQYLNSGTVDKLDFISGNTHKVTCTGGRSVFINPVDVSGDVPPPEKYLPISQVAAKVLSNAEAGHIPSQDAVKAAAAADFTAGTLNPSLDANAKPVSDDATTDPTTDPNNPNAPVPPFDPSGIIEAIKAVFDAIVALPALIIAGIISAITLLFDQLISLITSIYDAMTGFFATATEFIQSFNDTPPENPAQDVPVVPNLPDKSASDFDIEYINFGNQCPSLPSFNVVVAGVTTTMQFDTTPLCDLAVAIRPAIIAMGYFIATGLVAHAIRES